MTRDELIEKVAQTIAAADQEGMPDLVVYETYIPIARAAIDIVLEEAATIVDAFDEVGPARRYILATKIRALKSGDGDE